MATLGGFSSIHTRHANTHSTNNMVNSNFQSVIHEENGLYRKEKGASASLNSIHGYQIIDKKFTEKPQPEAVHEKNSITDFVELRKSN